MKKFLEERVDQLEMEVNLLKAKFKLQENKSKSTSTYLNNYTYYDPSKIYNYDGSLNLMSEPDLETAFASPFDKSDFEKNPLPTFTVKQPTHTDSVIENVCNDYQNLSFDDYPEYPEYPDICGSWDSFSDDIITEDQKPITHWGFVSEFDKMDKDFLEWIKKEGKQIYQNSLYKQTKNK